MVVCDKKTFEAEVLQEQRTVLVDFFGDGCAPCKALMPHIEEFEKQYGDKIKFCKLNITSARRLAISQKVMGLPVIAIYKNGEKTEDLVKDEATTEAIEEMINRYL